MSPALSNSPFFCRRCQQVNNTTCALPGEQAFKGGFHCTFELSCHFVFVTKYRYKGLTAETGSTLAYPDRNLTVRVDDLAMLRVLGASGDGKLGSVLKALRICCGVVLVAPSENAALVIVGNLYTAGAAATVSTAIAQSCFFRRLPALHTPCESNSARRNLRINGYGAPARPPNRACGGVGLYWRLLV